MGVRLDVWEIFDARLWSLKILGICSVRARCERPAQRRPHPGAAPGIDFSKNTHHRLPTSHPAIFAKAININEQGGMQRLSSQSKLPKLLYIPLNILKPAFKASNEQNPPSKITHLHAHLHSCTDANVKEGLSVEKCIRASDWVEPSLFVSVSYLLSFSLLGSKVDVGGVGVSCEEWFGGWFFVGYFV